jgi:hypothetical protein
MLLQVKKCYCIPTFPIPESNSSCFPSFTFKIPNFDHLGSVLFLARFNFSAAYVSFGLKCIADIALLHSTVIFLFGMKTM